MSVNATKVQVYVLPGVALTISLLCLIISIVVLLQSDSQGNPKEIVKVVTNANGFKGTISNNRLTLSTTATTNTLLKGPGLLAAVGSDVTKFAMTGFNNTNPGTAITASDTIKSGLEKCSVFNYTQLIGLIPFPDSIDETDTVFGAICNLVGSIQNIVGPSFSVYETVTVSGPTVTNLWGSMVGSPAFPANTIFPGCMLELIIFGSLTIESGTLISDTAPVVLMLNGDTELVSVPIPAGTTEGVFHFRISYFLTFTATTLTCFAILIRFPIDPFVATVSVRTAPTTIPFDPFIQNTLSFIGSTSSTTLSITVNSSICAPTCNQT